AVRPEEDGDLAQRTSGRDELRDPLGDTGRLRLVVVVDGQLGPGATLVLGDELDGPTPPLAGGAGEQRVGEGEDLRGRAVVAHETHGRRSGVGVGESEQVLWRRPGEGVDRLSRVTDDADVAPPAEPEVEQALLEGVDVLVLVDDEMPVLVADRAGDVLSLLEDADGE